jgi:hypothetical protein
MTSEDGTHSGFRTIISKFISHTAQKPQKQKNNTSYVPKAISKSQAEGVRE